MTEKGVPWEAKHSPPSFDSSMFMITLRISSLILSVQGKIPFLTLNLSPCSARLAPAPPASSFFTPLWKGLVPRRADCRCLEEEVGQPDGEKKRLDADDGMPDTRVSAMHILSAAGACGWEL